MENGHRGVTCVATSAYTARDADELSLAAGDVVRAVERVGGGWSRGLLHGRRGLFPDAHATEYKASVGGGGVGGGGGGVVGRCRALYSYTPANSDELALRVGEVLEVLGELEEGWWRGRTTSQPHHVGVFPSNFVTMIDAPPPPPAAPAPCPAPAPATSPCPAPKLPPKPVREQCRVVFPYRAVNEDELTLQVGDVVWLVSRDVPDKGWWRGELRGKQGLFPDNFVQLLPATPTAAPHATPTPAPTPAPAPTGGAGEGGGGGAGSRPLYPVLSKYSEKTASIKELSTSVKELSTGTSKITSVKESAVSKESHTHTHSTAHSNSHSHAHAQRETVVTHSHASSEASSPDSTPEGAGKKPAAGQKRSPAGGGASAVTSLLSGLKSKVFAAAASATNTTTTTTATTPAADKSEGGVGGVGGVCGEADRPDGGAGSKPSPLPAAAPAGTFDHVHRQDMLNDPRAHRVKAPRRRPPSQALRDDAPPSSPSPPPLLPPHSHHLTNGDHVPSAPGPGTPPIPAANPSAGEAGEPGAGVRGRAREWEKQRAPWMDELRLSQARKQGPGPGAGAALGDDMSRSMPAPALAASLGPAPPASLGPAPPASLGPAPPAPLGPAPPTPDTSAEGSMGMDVDVGVSARGAGARSTTPTLTAAPARLSYSPTAPGRVSRSPPSPVSPPAAPSEPASLSALLQRIENLEAAASRQEIAHAAALDELRRQLAAQLALTRRLQHQLDQLTSAPTAAPAPPGLTHV